MDGVSWTQATDAAPFSGRWDHTSAVFDDRLWVIGGVTDGVGTVNDVWAFGID